ncbi:hypothetical protein H5410_046715 [Solanum commersonii]|uniref:Uncharacterized protein n=1 Tax=Solanum commersonii TaxID=4109 RepID=A0A9J5XD15_SOLCO|nr:hypothetical protein H5410_046715 [Solanum commersonii]
MSEIRIKALTALNPQHLVPSGASKRGLHCPYHFMLSSTGQWGIYVGGEINASNKLFDDIHHFGVLVDLGAGVTTIDCSAESQSIACQDNVVPEPFIGMEFESEDVAKEFYDDYARHVGFIMRIDQCRHSEVDKRIFSR